MARKKGAIGRHGLAEKHAKWLNTGWMDEADAMNEDDLKKAVIDSSNAISEQEKLREENTKLKEAKEWVKDLEMPHKETIAYQTAKIKYALILLEKSGKI